MEVDDSLAILIVTIVTVVYIACIQTFITKREIALENKTIVCEDRCTTHWYYNVALKMMMPYTTCNKCDK